jgi:hypothetical protein
MTLCTCLLRVAATCRGTSEAADAVCHTPSPAHLSRAPRPRHCAPSCPAPSHESPNTTTMITSGFTNAPVAQFLVFAIVVGALAASLTDTRYYMHIQVVPHIWAYGQVWRFLTWQVRCRSVFCAAKGTAMRAHVAGRALTSATAVLHKLHRGAVRSRQRLQSARC